MWRIYKIFSIGMCVCLTLLMMTACTTETARNTGKGYNIKREGQRTFINDDILISTGNYYDENLILVTSGKEATLIDTGNGQEESLRVKEYIEENQLILKYIIITNLDKANYLSLFKTEETIVIPPGRVENNQTIQMGDKVFKLLITPGYGDSNNISIELNESILFAGDIITENKEIPLIRTYKNVPDTIKTLEDLKTKNYDLIVPAHGPIIEDSAFIDEYLDILKELISGVEFKKQNQLNVINKDIVVSTGNYLKVNMTLIVSGKEATLIDVGFDKAEALEIQKYIQSNNLKLKNVIITHEHTDHVANLNMFLEEDVRLYKFDDLQNNEKVITMGDKTLKMKITPGHIRGRHISVEVNDTILIAGDIIATNIKPSTFISWGGTRDALIKTLEELNNKNYTLIIPGHGDVCIGKEIIQEHLDSLKLSE